MTRVFRRTADDHRRGGFGLIELMIAATAAAVMIGAASSWLWSVGALARRVGDRAQAATLADAASREVASDVRSGLAVVRPPADRDASCSLALTHDHVDAAMEPVLFVWDPSRCVLWRNAAGTYVADHITLLDFSFSLADGRVVAGHSMRDPDWGLIEWLHVDLAATVGSTTLGRSVSLWVRSR